MSGTMYTIVIWSPGPDSTGSTIEKNTFIESFKKRYSDLKVFEKDGNLCAEIPQGHEMMRGTRVKMDSGAKKTIKSIGGTVNKFQPPEGSKLRAQEDIDGN